MSATLRPENAEQEDRRRVTAFDVARLAGVSRSTVSRSFTAGAPVSPEKRERILAVAERLGYRPNALAAGLNSRSSNLVAVVTGSLANHYDTVVTGQLVERLSRIGKWAVLVAGSSSDPESREILEVLGYPLEAMVVRAGSVDAETASKCLKLNVPLVVSGRIVDIEGVDSLGCDNVAGARIAVEEMLRTGRRRIGYIGGEPALVSEQERCAGFRSALAEAGMQPVAMEWSDFTFEGGFASASRMLARPGRADALFCCNDAMAIGALNAARDVLGLTVPGDLAIIGFDDIDMASWACFNLTTVRNPIDRTVDEIMRLVVSRLAEPDRRSEMVSLTPALVRRGTH